MVSQTEGKRTGALLPTIPSGSGSTVWDQKILEQVSELEPEIKSDLDILPPITLSRTSPSSKGVYNNTYQLSLPQTPYIGKEEYGEFRALEKQEEKKLCSKQVHELPKVNTSQTHTTKSLKLLILKTGKATKRKTYTEPARQTKAAKAGHHSPEKLPVIYEINPQNKRVPLKPYDITPPVSGTKSSEKKEKHVPRGNRVLLPQITVTTAPQQPGKTKSSPQPSVIKSRPKVRLLPHVPLPRPQVSRVPPRPSRNPVYPKRLGVGPSLPCYLDHSQDVQDVVTGREGQSTMPLSVIDRVAVVRNAMYEVYLRQSTKQLQDDLRHTMRVYSTEKQQLLKQLANLRNDMDESRSLSGPSTTPSSLSSSETSQPGQRRSRFYRAPNIAAHRAGKNKRTNNVPKDAQDGNFRLPIITTQSAPKLSQWDSGHNLSESSDVVANGSLFPGIAAANALLEDSFNIPYVKDPLRSEISVLTDKQSKKKVHFADDGHGNLSTVTEIESSDESSEEETKVSGENEEREKPQRKPKRRTVRKYKKQKKRLPPISELESVPADPQKNSQDARQMADDGKALYVGIVDPEKRTKTLADILYAVRMRMHENEQKLRYGEKPRVAKTDNTLCDYLLSSQDKGGFAETKQKKGVIPSNTAGRIGRRSNTVQLQNYLRKLSRSRRMIEHLEGEEYRLAHIVGNEQVLDTSQTAT